MKDVKIGECGVQRNGCNVRFKVLTAASMKFRVFWDAASFSHLEVNRRFRGAYCLHHHLRNVGLQRENSSVVIVMAAVMLVRPLDSNLVISSTCFCSALK
jgi:hypothetical protein